MTRFYRAGYAKRGICRRRMSVCLSHCSIVSKRLNIGSREFSDAKDPGEIRTGSPPTEATNAGGVVIIDQFRRKMR